MKIELDWRGADANGDYGWVGIRLHPSSVLEQQRMEEFDDGEEMHILKIPNGAPHGGYHWLVAPMKSKRKNSSGKLRDL
jgi:hypothetical protein